LANARLREASLSYARLGGAALVYADLRDTDLMEADHRRSHLGGATLCGARYLQNAKLEGALYDGTTRWPPGFDASDHGARRSNGARGYETPTEAGSGLSNDRIGRVRSPFHNRGGRPEMTVEANARPCRAPRLRALGSAAQQR
jgi:uncharacterized protein YjbI with pentapeptide repeats